MLLILGTGDTGQSIQAVFQLMPLMEPSTTMLAMMQRSPKFEDVCNELGPVGSSDAGVVAKALRCVWKKEPTAEGNAAVQAGLTMCKDVQDLVNKVKYTHTAHTHT